MRFGLRALLIFVAGVSVFLAIAVWLVGFVSRVLETPIDAYATWDGAELVIEHMRQNKGEWPREWADLQPIFHARGFHGRGGLTFEELKQRLEIDFDVDSAQLTSLAASSDTVPFNVIRLRNGRKIHWSGAEPNYLLYEYLRNRIPIDSYLRTQKINPPVADN